MKGFDERLAALRRAVEDPSTKEARTRLRRALDGKSGLLVAVATRAVEADPSLLSRLPAAFDRLMEDPVKRDPQCQGKVAIVKHLRDSELDADELLLRGVGHVQREPVWGGSVDTAAELRGVCLMALVEGHHPRAMIEAAHLLADPEAMARSAAARALSVCTDATAAEPLLRLRVAAGDPQPEVIGECLGALLQVAPRSALPFVTQRLGDADDAIAEAAALALGESRLPDALAPLQQQVQRSVLGRRRGVMMLAIAMLRAEAAWSWLVELVADGARGEAADALKALATFSHDERLATRVREAVAGRPDDVLASTAAELFGPAPRE